jgi:hypothetical protein
MTSPKRLARTAGVLYLLVGIFGGFAQGFVYPKIYAAGDAATTAGNLVANSGLVRIGVLADVVQATVWVFLAMALYRLLRQVHQSAAVAMVALAALGAGIACLNAVFEFEGMRVATGAVSLAVGAAGTSGLALLMVDAQHYGLLIDTVFQGLWLMPLGYLAYKSGLFPKALGALLVVGGVCYLVDVLAQFLAPDFGPKIATFVVIPVALAEISMVVYLLVIGVKTVKRDVRVSGAAATGVA